MAMATATYYQLNNKIKTKRPLQKRRRPKCWERKRKWIKNIMLPNKCSTSVYVNAQSRFFFGDRMTYVVLLSSKSHHFGFCISMINVCAFVGTACKILIQVVVCRTRWIIPHIMTSLYILCAHSAPIFKTTTGRKKKQTKIMYRVHGYSTTFCWNV